MLSVPNLSGHDGAGEAETGAYPRSYYAASCDTALSASPLAGDAITDYCIVGGGFTGLGAALRLAEAGHSVTLVEAEAIGWGASGRNGGQAHVGLRQDQMWLEEHLGEPLARRLWAMAMDGRAHLDTLLALDQDRCDFRPGHVYADHKASYLPHSQALARHMADRYDYHALRFVEGEEIRALVASDGYKGGLVDSHGGHLHPLKLALGMARAALAKGARLHPHTRATAITPEGDGWAVATPQGTIRAGRVLMAAGGYGKGLNREVDAHVMPINNFIATTAPLGAERAAALIAQGRSVSDSRFVVYYYRTTADHRLLFGGGETYSYRFPADIAGFVRPHMLKVFPQLADVALEHAWGGTLSITRSRMPFVRQVAPGLYTMSGFSGLGVILAPYFGRIMGEAMAGLQEEGFAALNAVPAQGFPGGRWLRWPTLVAAMSFFALRDRL